MRETPTASPWETQPAADGLPPLPAKDAPADVPDWADAPTDPNLAALRGVAPPAPQGGVRPEWPVARARYTRRAAVERAIAHARSRQLGIVAGAIAAAALLGALVFAAVTSNGLPFGGSAVPTQDIHANPAPTYPGLPAATATPQPTATATPQPTATPEPTPMPTDTPIPTATAQPTATPQPTPILTATPQPTAMPQPPAAPRAAATPHSTP